MAKTSSIVGIYQYIQSHDYSSPNNFLPVYEVINFLALISNEHFDKKPGLEMRKQDKTEKTDAKDKDICFPVPLQSVSPINQNIF
jgi:hypothetical protein